MVAIKIVWVLFNAIVVAWFNYIFLFNPVVLRIEHKWEYLTCEKMMFTLFGILAIFYCVVVLPPKIGPHLMRGFRKIL